MRVTRRGGKAGHRSTLTVLRVSRDGGEPPLPSTITALLGQRCVGAGIGCVWFCIVLTRLMGGRGIGVAQPAAGDAGCGLGFHAEAPQFKREPLAPALEVGGTGRQPPAAGADRADRDVDVRVSGVVVAD